MTITTRIRLAMFVVGLLAAAVTGLVVQVHVERAIKPAEEQRVTALVQRAATGLTAYFAGARSDMHVAHHLGRMEELLASSLAGEALAARPEPARDAFVTLLEAHPSYLQLRLIGGTQEGRELLRVERAAAGEPVRVVPAQALQAKGHRPYVRATLALDPGQMHISPINLNREHGKLQIPHIPVVRLGLPVTAGGQVRGAMILNIDTTSAFAQLRHSAQGLHVVGPRGEYLVHPDPSREFAEDLGHAHRFHADFPELADRLTATTRWTANTSSPQGPRLLVGQPLALLDGTPITVVGIVEPLSDTAARQAWPSSALSALGVAVLAMLAAWLVARSLVRPIVHMIGVAERSQSTARFANGSQDTNELNDLAAALDRMRATTQEKTQQLERQERRFRLLFESAPSALLLVEPDQRIVLANREAATTFGYAEEDFIGMPLDNLIPARLRAQHKQLARDFLQAPEGRSMALGREVFGRRNDDTEVPLEIGLGPIDGLDGVVTLASIVDISERKRQETELRARNEDLQQFAYVASHDLQEPLRIVSLYAQMLDRHYRDRLDEQGLQYLKFVTESARHGTGLVRDLLEYARVGSAKHTLRELEARDVVDRALSALHAQVNDAGATVEVAELPRVFGDASQLGQVFQNLISNAIKFRSEAPPHVTITGEPDDGYVRFRIADNGIGMDMTTAKNIFKLFNRMHSREKYDGSGIGLSIARRIVLRHGGDIWFESAPGQGTVFFFTLPTAAAGPRRRERPHLEDPVLEQTGE